MDEIDPIEELHEIRRKIIAKAGGTFDAYMRQIMEQQKQNPDRLVDLSKPKPQSRRSSVKPIAKSSIRKIGKQRQTVGL